MSTVSGENPDNLEEASSVAIKHAKNGKAWAQFQIGLYHSHGLFGFSLDEEKGLQLIKQAAEQRDSDALLELALALAYSGETLEPDEEKYMHYLKEAADLGHPGAQQMLGIASPGTIVMKRVCITHHTRSESGRFQGVRYWGIFL